MMNEVNADAIVHDIENRLFIFISIQTDLDAGMGLVAHKFTGVINQVLNHLDQPLTVSIHSWEVFQNGNINSPAMDLPIYKFNCVTHQFFKVNVLIRIYQPPNTCEFEQFA